MMMRQSMLPIVLSLLICCILAQNVHAAGQVVTQEIKEWAKKTLENEKSLAAAPDKNTMAILNYVNQTDRKELDPLEKGMTLMLLTDLSQVPNLRLVERAKLQALVDELKLGSSGLVTRQTVPRIGKLVGAGLIVGGEFSGKKKKFYTKSQIVEVASSKISGQFTLPGTLEDILKTEKELVFSIIKNLKIRLKPEVVAIIRKPCSTNLKALNAIFRGIDASDHGDTQQAGDLYNEALKADPDVCIAAAALQELMQLGMYTERSTSMLIKGKVSAANTAEAAPTAGSTDTATAKTETAETPRTETSNNETTKTVASSVEVFAPKSALTETAISVSSKISLTNPLVTKDVNQAPLRLQTGNAKVRWQ